MTRTSKPLRVAIVHDWLVGGGAEQVVEALHQLYPDAPIYTSYCTDEWRKRLDNKVVTRFLQHWPFSKLRKIMILPRIWWFTHLDFTGYDLVISSTGNGEAKGIRVPKGTTHVCYCHSPTHFYWRHYNQYMQQPGFGIFNPIVRLALRLLVGPLRAWDLKASKRPDFYIANSSHIQADIKKYYGRESVIIHPPIDTERFRATKQHQRSGFLIASRQVPQKRFDIAIQACNDLKLPLTVIGKGPEHAHLAALAGPTVTVRGYVPDKDLPTAFASAQAFIFPAFDDFGMVPVEAMAAGTPVIAFKAGGALDYVVPRKTGLFFEQQTVSSLKKTLQSFQPNEFDHATITKHAQQFSIAHFKQAITSFIDRAANK